MKIGGKATELVRWIADQATAGVGPLCSASELAAQYEADDSYADIEDRVAALIRWESAKNFGIGFVSGLGGPATLPVAVPSSLCANWVVQARLSATIAGLYGYDPEDDRVRTMVMASLLGDAGVALVRNAGVQVANKAFRKALEQIPGRLLIEINKKVGFRLLTKAGEKGVVNFMKFVPIAGGVVSGAVDGAACMAVGKAARAIFRG